MWRQAVPIGALVLIGCGFFEGCRGASVKQPGDTVVASFGNQNITMSQLEQRIGNQLLGLKTQEFEFKERQLREMITDLLVGQEATRRGKSAQQLLVEEVDSKVVPPTKAEIRARYEEVRERVKDRAESDVLKEIEAGLQQQRRAERHAAYVKELGDRAGLRLLIEPPRATIVSAGAPARGNALAPVTITEFSDFQCPWCARAAQTIHQIEQRYGDKLRVVFRHYPLPFHAQARKAAEAASCAAEQGKFWEMHDKLFATQGDLAEPALKKRAAELGLDSAKFDQCLDSNRHSTDWQRDVAEGQQIGVSSTPSFFVNGRLITGAQPLERFIEVVDAELARASAPTPKR